MDMHGLLNIRCVSVRVQLRQLLAPVGSGGPGGDPPPGRSQQRSPRHPLSP